MLVSGHGSSPKCREVEYNFLSRDGKTHTAKFLEYFQFKPIDKKYVEVETKEYPIEFDGINWKDKKGLEQAHISHIFRDYVEASEKKLIGSREVEAKSIEGLLLADGVFLGNIRLFSSMGNPVVILNTCGSLLELGEHLSLAGARACMGTMWSIFDEDARQFAPLFFECLPNNSLAQSFTIARSTVKSLKSRLAYAYFGTLDSFLHLSENTDSDPLVKDAMAKRIFNGLNQALMYFYAGWLGNEDIHHLSSIGGILERFEEKHISTNVELRKRSASLRTMIQNISN